MESLPKVAIIELGCQTTLLIERSLRELGIRSVILDPKRAPNWLTQHSPRLIIFSGGAASVYEPDAPRPPIVEALDLVKNSGTVLLGICYGMQWIAQWWGAKVINYAHQSDYGPRRIELDRTSVFFRDTPRIQEVWMSHGDSITEAPDGFYATARTDSGIIAAMQHLTLPIYAVQFHPEVTHTPYGKQMLVNLVHDIARCEQDWVPTSIIADVRSKIDAQVGNARAIFGMSGGVDSTTMGAILSPTLGDRLLGITIDGGHLRENELEEIARHAEAAGVIHKIIDARGSFAAVMTDTIDAEEKRKRFKKVYTAVLVKAAQEFGAKYVLQGTLAPDRIESGATGGALIKSHHNVGLDMGELVQLHPLDHLFKYEVRALARELELPESVCGREPFPGPGLFLRVVGVPATPDKLKIVQWATARTREILERHGLYQQISQLVVAYMGVNTTAVKGSGRSYKGGIVVRPVESLDFMTAKGKHLPDEVEDAICETLTRHPEINRTWFDYTPKPPATTEME